MSTRWSALFVVLIGAGVGLLPVAYKSHTSTEYRNFRVVEPGKLYRSGQMPPRAFTRVVREHGIQTVISFRDTKDGSGVHEDQYEKDYCDANGMTFRRLPFADWTRINGVAPADENMTEFLKILDADETKYPVLVHCFAGIHRTGAHIAVYRMEYQGWTSAEAIEEMRSMGTPRTTFANNLIDYLETYKPQRKH